MRKTNPSAVFTALFIFASAPVRAVDEEFLFQNFETPALLTKIDKNLTPAAVTTITEEDIKLTPARNLYDLLEVFVPGAFWTFHNEGFHLGVRGLASDRETKALLLVNGVRVNQDSFAGAVDEIANWDLNDVREVQVIRGPGSVTYGPGAISMVINILTHDPSTAPRLAAGTKAVSFHRSYGAYAQGARQSGGLGYYAYASAVKTSGHVTDTFDVNSGGGGGFGYYGRTFDAKPGVDWLRSWRDQPETKAHVHLDFLGEWKFWMRYNAGGFTHDPTVTREKVPASNPDFNFERQIRNRYALAMLENTHDFTQAFRLKSSVGYHTYDRIKEKAFASASPYLGGRDDPRNRESAFGVNRFMAETQANLLLSDKYEVALGAGYENEFVGHGWNRSPQDFRIGNYFSGADTNASTAPVTSLLAYDFVGKGWYATRWSGVAEANLQFHPKATVILSGRADKHSYSTTLLSPRAAFVSNMGDAGVYKLVHQKALRMPTSLDLLDAHRAGVKPRPETLRGTELIWNNPAASPLALAVSAFHNKSELLGFSQTTRQVTPLGTMSWAGIELEAKRSGGALSWSANHSYVDLLRFRLGAGTNIAQFSYADAERTQAGGVLGDTGNNINNWANNATKMRADWKVLDKRLTLHADARLFWGFEGKKDYLEMYQKLADQPGVSAANRANILAAIDALNRHHVNDISYRVNVSVDYKVTEPLSVTAYVFNLLGNDRNLRYAFDGGANATFPSRNEAMEEPRFFGLRVDYRL